MAETLHAMGVVSFIEPLLSVLSLQKVSLENVHTLIVTSRNGLKAVQKPVGHVTAYCVGTSTALLAKELGFEALHVAASSVESLLDLFCTRAPDDLGKIVYVAGDATTEDLEGILRPLGYDITTEVAYKAVPRVQFSPSLCDHFSRGHIKQVSLFSRNTAEIFMQLAISHQISLKSIDVFCLSEKIAKALSFDQWKNIFTPQETGVDSFWQLVKNHVE